MFRIALLLLCQCALQTICMAQTSVPQPVEGDVVVRNFRFESNEVLPELRLHYRTIGKLERDGQGVARNAVLIMHGTGGSGAQFLRADFADRLFRAGGVLDATKYFIVLPDGIGHGKSATERTRWRRYGNSTWRPCCNKRSTDEQLCASRQPSRRARVGAKERSSPTRVPAA